MAHAGNGGLQKHSIGDSYPWTVIGTIVWEGKAPHVYQETRYYVENLVTGEKVTHANGHLYNTSAAAHGVAQARKDIQGALQ